MYRDYLMLVPSLLVACVGCDGSKATSSHGVIADTHVASSKKTESLPNESTLRHEIRPTTADDTVSVRLTYHPQVRHGDKLVVNISFDVEPGYELQSVDAKPPKQSTRVDFRLPKGWSLDGKMAIPQPKRSRITGNGPSYSGQFMFQQMFSSSPDADMSSEQIFECIIHYQACDDRKCLRPVEVVLKFPVSITK